MHFPFVQVFYGIRTYPVEVWYTNRVEAPFKIESGGRR